EQVHRVIPIIVLGRVLHALASSPQTAAPAGPVPGFTRLCDSSYACALLEFSAPLGYGHSCCHRCRSRQTLATYAQVCCLFSRQRTWIIEFGFFRCDGVGRFCLLATQQEHSTFGLFL